MSKKRIHYCSPDAADIIKQLKHIKKEKARRILESQLVISCIESYIDLKEKKAVVIYTPNLPAKRDKYINEAAEVERYNLEKVDIWDTNEYVKHYRELPKSSVIEAADTDPLNMPEIHATDKEGNPLSKSEVEELMDVRDYTFEKAKLEHVSYPRGQREAGRIYVFQDVRTDKMSEHRDSNTDVGASGKMEKEIR